MWIFFTVLFYYIICEMHFLVSMSNEDLLVAWFAPCSVIFVISCAQKCGSGHAFPHWEPQRHFPSAFFFFFFLLKCLICYIFYFIYWCYTLQVSFIALLLEIETCIHCIAMLVNHSHYRENTSLSCFFRTEY